VCSGMVQLFEEEKPMELIHEGLGGKTMAQTQGVSGELMFVQWAVRSEFFVFDEYSEQLRCDSPCSTVCLVP
jgi:hypothetical protein